MSDSHLHLYPNRARFKTRQRSLVPLYAPTVTIK